MAKKKTRVAEPKAVAKAEPAQPKATAEPARKAEVPTPEGHPETLSDEQKLFIHAERKKNHVDAIEKIDDRIADLRKLGKAAGSFPRRWVDAHGVKETLLARKYAVDKGHDPLNYQVRFGDKG